MFRGSKYDESYIGQKNNMLTVVGITRNKRGKKAFLCKCDCGNTKLVQPTIWAKGYIKSCGCYAKSLRVENNIEKHRLQNIFRGMIQRCYNSNDERYPNYGGRGIKICDEWLNDRNQFYEWALSHGYSNDLSIDRIEVDGNYEPDNCRWATAKMQANNRRPSSEWKRVKRYKVYDKRFNLKELGEAIGCSCKRAKKIYQERKEHEIDILIYINQFCKELLNGKNN